MVDESALHKSVNKQKSYQQYITL